MKVMGVYVECPACHRLMEAGAMLDPTEIPHGLAIAQKVHNGNKIDWQRQPAPPEVLRKLRERLLIAVEQIDYLLTR